MSALVDLKVCPYIELMAICSMDAAYPTVIAEALHALKYSLLEISRKQNPDPRSLSWCQRYQEKEGDQSEFHTC